MNPFPFISVIVPVYNEEKFIDALIENFIHQDYPENCMEWIFVDGMSSDKTLEILKRYQAKYSFIQVLDNPDRYVSYALNKAIAVAKGTYIIRMDAHSIYPSNYWSVLVRKSMEYQADNVGGMWVTQPGDRTDEALAIVYATSHPVGIGNASYRLGSSYDKQTDTVPYGCFPATLFKRIGVFDTDLIRNQDDEFNGRIIKNGGKIFLIPSLKIEYFARPTWKKLATMFYQYGLFKPLVNIKLGAPATLRQLAPPIFVTSIVLLTLGALLLSLLRIPCLTFIGFYGISVLMASLHAVKRWNPKLWLLTAVTFPVIHFSYGIGYIFGLFRFTLMGEHKRGKININSSR